MMLGLNLSLMTQHGGGTATGPAITAPGSLDVSTFKIGVEHTITAGTAEATGGGTVTYEFRWLVNGATVVTVAAYTPDADDNELSIVAQWRAVETGGTNDGETPWQTVGSGTVTYVAPTLAASDSLTGRTLTISVDSLTPAGMAALTSLTLGEFPDQVDVLADATGSGPWEYVVPGSLDPEVVTWEVTATNSGGADTATGSETVAAGGVAPSILSTPTISGAATVGSTLTASPAGVSGAPTPARTWQWLRDAVAISGGTSITYTLVGDDNGTDVSVRQIETNDAGTDTADSAAVSVTGDSTAPTGTDAFITPVGGEDLRLQITDLSEDATYWLAVVDAADNAPTFDTGTDTWTAGASSTLRDTVSQAVVVGGGPYSVDLVDTLDGNYDVYRVRSDAVGNYSAVEKIGDNLALNTIPPASGIGAMAVGTSFIVGPGVGTAIIGTDLKVA